ncbi:hypothetical protein PIB30_088680 [Stylosanthes scabra]|uniref:Uncharacterized protein n=1 Tax=Stylosanthes scabra TaxID=79078 RepID=A0ABU6ZSG8_9FABA|nr:hypothetical protein [Stylosanthes scabra]
MEHQVFGAVTGDDRRIDRTGNKDKQTLSFDPEIEKTLRKLRKQAKLQEHSHEISFEEVFEEEEFEDRTGDNMAANENNRGWKLADFSIPSVASCGSSVVRPAVDVNNFELKPSFSAGSAGSILWKSFRRSQSTYCQLSPHQ